MIVTEKLTRLYGEIRAVDSLDLEVYQGEIFGFLGPNGAGKTTTIRILTTLTKPTSGQAWINGLDVLKESLKVKEVIGVVQQTLSLDRELTVQENMELHARLRYLEPRERKLRIAELLDYVELTDQARRLVEDLSGGMRRRLMIARALIHRPRLLFLDEPTVGLDVQTRRRLWELIRHMNSSGATVFLTTHYIEEAEALCGRVGIIDRGRLIALGKPAELCLHLGPVTVEVCTNDGDRHHQQFPDRTAAASFVQSLSRNGKATVRETNLEDVFVELTGRKVGDE